MSASLAGPEPFSTVHRTPEFHSGRDELDTWLNEHALEAQQAQTARVYVIHEDGLVVGYFALAAAEVRRGEIPRAQRGRLPRHPIPCVLIARLAVDEGWQGQGLGAALLKDALLRAVSASEVIGIRAVLVHAKDDDARKFYERFQFRSSPTDPLHLFVSIKDILKAMP